MKYFFLLFFANILACHSPTLAQISQGDNLIDYDKLRYHKSKKEGLGKINSNKAKSPQELELEVVTTKQPDFIHQLATVIPLTKKEIKAGETLLLSFTGKTEEASLETGEAKMLWILNVSDNPKEKKRHTMSIGGAWRTYYVPISIEQTISPKHLRLVLQFGFPPQTLLIKNLKFEKYDASIPLAALPETKITYPGMETDASWRKAALERIEMHRKGDFQIQFSTKGKAIKNQEIQLRLKRHNFSWGAAISSKKMIQDPERLSHFSKAFNLAVFENDLKIKFWNKPGRKTIVLKTIAELEQLDIDIKGHVLIWPGFRHLTPNFRRHQDNPQKVISLMDQHLDDILNTTKGKVSRWDVVNEAYTNKDLQRITGSEQILFNGFRELSDREDQVLRFTNEYGIISKGGIDKKKQQWYYDYIKRVDENTNGKVDGIGVQCHIGTDLTPPEKVLNILNFYATLDKKISISEFTMTVTDPEVRYQYTTDFLIAAFSHPSVSEFLFWGYQDERADIFKEDWTLGVMGEAFFSLVHEEWKTNFLAKTDSKGKIKGNGFYGTYEYTFIQGDKVIKGEFEFEPGQSKIIKIKI